MRYAFVEDGEITDTDLPDVGTLPDGRQVSGFDKLDPETLKEAGWHQVEDPGFPEDVSEDQTVQQTVVLQDNKPVIVYEIIDNPPVETTVEERLSNLERRVEALEG